MANVKLGSSEYPFGNGREDCKACLGRGVVPSQAPRDKWNVCGTPVDTCRCVLWLDLEEHLERQLPGTWDADPALCVASPGTGEDWHIRLPDAGDIRSWIRKGCETAGRPKARPHVITDASILDASLGNENPTGTRGAYVGKFSDPGTIQGRNLLVILLGKHRASNAMLPGYIEGVLTRRALNRMPTWVVESSTSKQSDDLPSLQEPRWNRFGDGSTSSASTKMLVEV